jgi:hypothetical protein
MRWDTLKATNRTYMILLNMAWMDQTMARDARAVGTGSLASVQVALSPKGDLASGAAESIIYLGGAGNDINSYITSPNGEAPKSTSAEASSANRLAQSTAHAPGGQKVFALASRDRYIGYNCNPYAAVASCVKTVEELLWNR